MISHLLIVLALLGSVEGHVIATAGGEPIEGAEIAIDQLGMRVVTDSGGLFAIPDLPAGRWTIRVSAEGYEVREMVVRVPDGGEVRLDIELERALLGAPAARGSGLSGVVREQGRLEPVRYATVSVVEVGTITGTDVDGVFSLATIPAGTWTLAVEAPGYQRLETRVQVAAGAQARMDLRLLPEPITLEGLTARPSRLLGRTVIESPEAFIIDTAMMNLVPVAIERDVLRSVQALPSVTPSSDFSSALFVRGGTPDQTRVLLDGMPLYNPYHLGGFASAINASAVDVTSLSAGGLPASAPSSLSGILEIHTRDGARDSVRVSGGMGLLSSSTTVDGPMFGGRGGFLVSGRRTYIDAALDAARGVGLTDSDIPYAFTDLMAKFTLDLSPGRSLTISGYVNDEGWNGDSTRGDWGSDVVGLRFRSLLGDRAQTEVGVSRSGLGIRGIDGVASLGTWTAHGRVQVSAGSHLFFAGAFWERTGTEHDLRPQGSDRDIFPTFQATGTYGSTAVFIRDRWGVGKRLVLDWGLRAEKPLGRSWQTLPRGRAQYEFRPSLSVAVSGGRYVQNWWSLRDEEGILSSVIAYDVPVPVPTDEPLAIGWDAVLELRARIANWTVRSDAYVKRQADVTTTFASLDPEENPFLLAPDSIELGDALIEGVELSFAGRLGRTPISLAYRWQRERRRLGGISFTPRTERRHTIRLGLSRPWGEREVAIALTWMTGYPFSPAVAVLPGISSVSADGRPMDEASGFLGSRVAFGDPNSARLPSYLRLDVDVRGDWDVTVFGKRGQLEPYLSVLNVFNRRNVLFADHRGSSDARLYQNRIPQLPVIPSFGIRWSF